MVHNAKPKVEITKSCKAKSKMEKQFSTGIFAGGCFLSRNCQCSNRANQLEPTKVRKILVLYSVYSNEYYKIISTYNTLYSDYLIQCITIITVISVYNLFCLKPHFMILDTNIIINFTLIKRSGDWWKHIVLETFTSQEWLENFCLSKDTFDHLCTQLTPHLQCQDTHLRKV